MNTVLNIGPLALDPLHLSIMGGILALALIFLLYRQHVEKREITYQHQIETLAGAEDEAEAQRTRAEQAEQALAAARAAASVTQMKAKEEFMSLAQQVLAQSQDQFMTLANETFAKHKEGAKGDLEKLIAPIGSTFEDFKTRVDALEKVRLQDRSAMGEQIRTLAGDLIRNRVETSKLVTALSSPKGAGRWGEMTLRNVIDQSGLSVHCDFVEQAHMRVEERTLRPDLVIRLPGQRMMIVDAKVSLEAYLQASQVADATQKDSFLKRHAQNIKSHIHRLASKAYQEAQTGQLDFVTMFIPGENFYAAALEEIPDLMEYAQERKVIITTPSTLLAIARAVDISWREQNMSENARIAAELGSELYDRLQTLTQHIEKLGKHINQSVDSYNRLNGSLERRVLPTARKFQELSFAPADKSLAELEPIENRAQLPHIKTETAPDTIQ